MPRERQSSFAAGVLSPTLWGRTDMQQYLHGCRQLLNFIVSQHGVLMNRSGTQHVALLSDQSGEHPAARLYAFVGTDPDDTWVLAFMPGIVRVFRENLDAPRFDFEAVTACFNTPYDADDLPKLRFSQDGDELIVTCNTTAPQLFTRDGDNLLMEELSFEAALYPAGVSIPALHTVEGTGLLAGGATIAPRQALGLDPLVGQEAEAQLEGDESHPRREWSWQVTRIVRDADGKLYETMPVTLANYYVSVVSVTDADASEAGSGDTIRTIPRSVAVYPDWPQRIILDIEAFNESISLSLSGFGELPEDHAIEKSRIYRGRDGVYGYLGETTGSFFVDEGATPDFSNPPPQGRNPFEVLDSDGAVVRTECPAVVTHFEGRRYFAATPERPSTLFGSAIDKLQNFDEVTIPDAEDALEFRLRGDRHQEIRALVSRDRFLAALTRSGEWIITGSGAEEVIKPGSVAAHQLGTHGCSATCPPLSLDDAILFVNAKGVTPRAMRLEQGGGAQHADLSVLARDLFDGYTIVDWAYAEDPFSVIWAVRSDGALLSCTYLPEVGILAWAKHELAGGGLVESVCVKPEAGEDAVYLSVLRGDRRYLERLAYRVFTGDVRDSVHLDRCVTYDGRAEADADTEFVFSPEVEADPVAGTFRAYHTGTSPWGTGNGGNDFIGEVVCFYDPDTKAMARGLVEWYGTSAGKKFYNIRFLEIDPDDAVERYAWLFADAAINPAHALPESTVTFGDWAKAVRSVSGLSHLNGETVTAVVDGEVRRELAVTGGSLSLGEDQHWVDYAGIVHVGLPYSSDFESLDAIQERGKMKAVSEVFVEIERTRGGSVGIELVDVDDEAADDVLVELPSRETEDDYTLMQPKREEHAVSVPSDWERNGRVAFRQSEPMPCTILGISREYELGG